jgi:hypothetical protein
VTAFSAPLWAGASTAGAQEPAPPAEPLPTDEAKTSPLASATPSTEAPTFFAEAPAEAPPPLPRKKGLVLESSLGALGFGGSFRHVAPTAYWLHAQLGYEVWRWLMIFGEGELAYTDTSIAQDPTKARAFPILGFGGGLRATIHLSDRVAIFAQGDVGALKADVPRNALSILGFRDAESFNPYFGARLGVEWYQVDRHFAIGAAFGVKDAQGFARLAVTADTPLMWDAGASIRYTF